MLDPLISIIIPVKNEADLLENCLASISRLDYPQERIEVIVADGLSTDGTPDVAKKYDARIVINNKRTVSPGRNVAFKIAKGALIAFTDADCIVDSHWIKNSIKYFQDEKVGCVGGPNISPPDEGNFGKAVSFVFGQKIFASGSIHARNLKEIKEVRSIPGCNAIYRRDALTTVMPIDESLLTCDDTELNQRLVDHGYKLLYTPDVFVWHYRRPNVRRLWRQIYRYAIGRLQVGKRDRRMINMTHILVGMGMPIILLMPILSLDLFFSTLLIWSVFLCLLVIYALMEVKSFSVAVTVPLVVIIVFLAWSSGFMRELVFPLKSVEDK